VPGLPAILKEHAMSEKDWDLFFDLVDKLIDLTPGATWQDKRDEVQRQAKARCAETELEEFTGWFAAVPED
jgi:hypothetical protein